MPELPKEISDLSKPVSRGSRNCIFGGITVRESSKLEKSKNEPTSKRADTPTANPFGDRFGRLYQRFAGNPKATNSTVRQLPDTARSGGKKHKTFKNKLRNRNKK